MMTRRDGPRLTAAVCTSGRPESLARALESLARQRRPPAEVVVVDNAPSDDRTRVLIARRFPAVRYCREDRLGLNFARNRALSEGSGDVVAFLDDDAVADDGWSAAFLDAYERRPNVAACTGRVLPFAVETRAQRLFEANGGFDRGTRRLELPRDAERRLHGWSAPLIAWAVSMGCGCSFAVRRSAVLDIGGFDAVFGIRKLLPGGDEHDVLWRLLDAGWDVVYEPEAVAWHEHRPELDAVAAQLAGHQRGLIAFLAKTARGARGGARVPVVAFLLWRLLKPGVRLLRRLAGRDPLPAGMLVRMWWECWRGLPAYWRVRSRVEQRTGALP